MCLNTVITFTKNYWILPMHSNNNNNNNNQRQCLWCCHRDHGHCERNVTIKYVSWPHFSWATLYICIFSFEFSHWTWALITSTRHCSVYDIEVFVCCTLDNMPNVLWIWDIPKLRLAAVLIQLSPIKSEWTAKWLLLDRAVYMKTNWFSDRANFTFDIWLYHVS